MGRIRAVSFDAGNTLIRVRESVGEVYARAARRRGVAAQGERLEQLFRREFAAGRNRFVAAVSRPHSPAKERSWWRDLVARVFRGAGLAEPLGNDFDAVFEELYEEFATPQPWEVFPDVEPCLDILEARGVPSAVVSNWDSRLHRVLAGLGLAERFRFVLTSAEFGAEKPDPAIFREASRRLGVPPPSVVHVGDLLRDDVAGPRAAGLRAAQLVRDGNPCGAEPCLRSLAELAPLLEAG